MNLPPIEPQEQFSGFLSGFETTMLINTKRLYIKIEIPSKEMFFECIIKYDPVDPLFIEVKKVFTNLDKLFKYIEEYSEDIERIKVNLKELSIKIVKNEGPRRLKNSPVLELPLKKVIVYQNKAKTKLHIEIETAIQHNQMLRQKFEQQKKARVKMIEEQQILKQEISRLIKSNGMELTLLQEELRLYETQNGNENSLKGKKQELGWENGLNEEEMEMILEEKEYRYDKEGSESLFFEDESGNGVPRSGGIKLEQKGRTKEEKKSEDWAQRQQESFRCDPFSYLY